MQFTVSFEFIYEYWNQVQTKHENLLSISLESEQKQGREYMQFSALKAFICLFIFDYKAVSLCKR